MVMLMIRNWFHSNGTTLGSVSWLMQVAPPLAAAQILLWCEHSGVSKPQETKL